MVKGRPIERKRLWIGEENPEDAGVTFAFPRVLLGRECGLHDQR